MIIWLPLSIIFLINGLLLGSDDIPNWKTALAFLILGVIFLCIYIAELEDH